MATENGQLRAIATAMLILGILVEIVAVVLMVLGRPVPSAHAVLVAGLMLVLLGVITLAQRPR